jgi:hypothetical protein
LWCHVAGVYDNSVLRVYVNGHQTSKPAAGDVAYASLNFVNIGRRGGTYQPGTRVMDGVIDEVRFWNVVRSSSQIMENMTRLLTGSEPGLVAYWRFDEGQGPIAYDSAGIHDGTLVNGPVWGTVSTDANGNGIPDECECSAQCPPGSMTLEGPDGTFSGWCATTSHPDSLVVGVTDVDLGTGSLVLNLRKEYLYPPGFGGVITPILVDFTQVCPDENMLPNILIDHESIANHTGVPWSEFRWTLTDANEVWFDVAASAGFDTSPFGNAVYGGFLDPPTNNRAKWLHADGGVLADGSSFFPGLNAGEQVMRVDLSGEHPVSFTLKERPLTGSGQPPAGASPLVSSLVGSSPAPYPTATAGASQMGTAPPPPAE